MRTRLPRLLALVAGLAALSLPTVALAQESTTTLTATLTGEVEVPGPGDPDGTGTARITLREGQVCFNLTWDNIGGANQGHIHQGAPGVAGPIVVPLFEVPDPLPPGQNSQEGCVDAEAAVIDAIRQNPAGYYVNVHTPELPKGAIRGQLQAASQLPFTGSSSRPLLLAALSLMAAGTLLLAAVRRYAPAHARRLSRP
jgi:CHRD domain/LPXTG cell wall anchor motif